MKYENPELRDRLAAEYALGTLRGAARRRFQKLMAGDPALRDLTLQWEMRLNDMAAVVKPVTPRPQLWQAIDRALGPVPRPQHERPGLLSGLWESLGFWRASAFGGFAVAAALMLFIAIGRAPVAPETRYIAVLIDDKATPVLVASLTAEDGKLSIKSVKADQCGGRQGFGAVAGPAGRDLGAFPGRAEGHASPGETDGRRCQ